MRIKLTKLIDKIEKRLGPENKKRRRKADTDESCIGYELATLIMQACDYEDYAIVLKVVNRIDNSDRAQNKIFKDKVSLALHGFFAGTIMNCPEEVDTKEED